MSRLHTELVGQGRPQVAFLHGLFGRGRNWTRIAQGLAAAGLPSVLVDLPNHGRSAWTEDFDYAAQADLVADELELRLGSAARLMVVGHSMGGKVAMQLALRRPGLVCALAVIDIAPADSPASDIFVQLLTALRGLDLSALTSRAEADQLLREAIPQPDVRSFLLQNLRRGPQWHWQPNLELLAGSLPQIRGWPVPDEASYPGPVLWLTGERSPYVGPEEVPAMRALFPAAEWVSVPGAGHWVHADAPEVVTAQLIGLAERAGLIPG